MRWTILLGVLTTLGGMTFLLLVARPALAALAIQSESVAALRHVLTWGITGTALITSTTLLAASVVQLMVQASVVYETSVADALGEPLISLLTETDWGRLWIWRALLAAFMVAVLAVEWRRIRNEQESRSGTAPIYLVTALALGVLVTISLTSHAAATPNVRIMALLNDLAHMVGGGSMDRGPGEPGHDLVCVRCARRGGEAAYSGGPSETVFHRRRTQRRSPGPDGTLLCVGAGYGDTGALDAIRVDAGRQNRPRRAAVVSRRRQPDMGQAQTQVQRPRRLLAEAAGSRRVHPRSARNHVRRIPDSLRTSTSGRVASGRGYTRSAAHLSGVRRGSGDDAPNHSRAGRSQHDRGVDS